MNRLKPFKAVLVFLILPFFLSWNVDWIDTIKKQVDKINKSCTPIMATQSTISGVNHDIAVYKTRKETKVSVTSHYEPYMKVSRDFFKNDMVIFATLEKGIKPLKYQEKRNANQPYAILFEKTRYFKHKNLGIEHFRALPVYGHEDYENLRLMLSKKAFTTKTIGLKDYILLENQYRTIEKSARE